MKQASATVDRQPTAAQTAIASLVRTLVPELLRTNAFQLALQMTAWQVRDAIEAESVYLLRRTQQSLLTLQSQAGPPPGEEGFAQLRQVCSADLPDFGRLMFEVVDDEAQTISVKSMVHLRLDALDDYTIVMAVVKDSFSASELAGLKYLGTLLAPVLGSVLRHERASNELIGARRLVHDTKAEQRAKSAFLNRMSHDLRTPLGVVLGFAQLLELEKLSKKQNEFVQHILHSGRQLLALINQVLELTDIDSGKLTLQLQPIQVSSVVTKCVEAMLPKAREKQLKLVMEPAEGEELWMLVDPDRFEQIIFNLLSNAIKFNVDKGVVRVSWMREGDKFVRIQVRDTGPGVPKNQIARMFDPFERLNASSKIEGTGLGLAISKVLSQALGGSLSAESRLGQGSIFSVNMPLAKAPPANNQGTKGQQAH